ncbi:MAG: exosortase E/protease, VPEID-CTERM system, partial [Planctomycetes bacterium]|nr:exosortase E/protease, VPEID-CTERM system [Planctomycetota bacterium]
MSAHTACRWATLAILLTAEVLVLSIRFDTGSLQESSIWLEILGRAPLLPQLGIALLTALAVLGGHRLRQVAMKLAETAAHEPFPWRSLVAHLAALGVFFQLTAVVLEQDIQSSPLAVLWLAAWISAGVLWLACWGAAVVPVSLWREALRRGGQLLMVAIGVAAAAIAAGELADKLWRPLGWATLRIVELCLRPLYSQLVVHEGDLIVSIGSFSVQIAPSCSGYEGMGLMAVVVSVYLWCRRGSLRFPHALLLLPIGIAAIWFANAARIAALIAIGASISQGVALGGFHSQAGWLAFNVVALSVIVIAERGQYFAKTRRSAANEPSATTYPAAPFLCPLLALVAVAMVTGAFSSGFDYLYPLRVVAAIAVLCCFRRAYRSQRLFHWTWSWAPFAIGLAVFGTWMLLEALFGAGAEVQSSLASGLAGLPAPQAILWLAFRAIGSVIIVPVAEELAFRGYLGRRLVAEDFESVPLNQFSWFAFIVSSAVFGLLHGRWLA